MKLSSLNVRHPYTYFSKKKKWCKITIVNEKIKCARFSANSEFFMDFLRVGPYPLFSKQKKEVNLTFGSYQNLEFWYIYDQRFAGFSWNQKLLLY